MIFKRPRLASSDVAFTESTLEYGAQAAIDKLVIIMARTALSCQMKRRPRRGSRRWGVSDVDKLTKGAWRGYA